MHVSVSSLRFAVSSHYLIICLIASLCFSGVARSWARLLEPERRIRLKLIRILGDSSPLSLLEVLMTDDAVTVGLRLSVDALELQFFKASLILLACNALFCRISAVAASTLACEEDCFFLDATYIIFAEC